MVDILKIIAGFVGAIATVLIWWISRLLSDKKDIISNSIHIETLNKRMDDVEEDMKEQKRDFNHYKDRRNPPNY